MLRTLAALYALCAFVAFAPHAKADEPAEPQQSNAQLILNLQAISASSTTASADESEDAQDRVVESQPLGGSYAEVVTGPYAIYFYPFQDARQFSLGYVFNENLELGVDLGMNVRRSKTDGEDDEQESLSNTVGAYAGWTQPISSVAAEFTLVHDRFHTDTETSNATSFSINAVVPLAPNLSYVGGFDYTVEKHSHATYKTTGVNVASLRLTL